jgi:hypothetical protein
MMPQPDAAPVAEPRRWPVTLRCDGTEAAPHETVTWLGTWITNDESSCAPPCWVCGAPPHTTSPRYPYVPPGCPRPRG